MSLESELLKLGEDTSKKAKAAVDKWKAENPNFLGMLEDTGIPGLKEVEAENKRQLAIILKKYNKL